MNTRPKSYESQNRILLNQNFISACRDYSYLMDHHYPERGSIKMVGDRYRLSRDQRTVLYRGISSQERSALRRSRLIKNVIDGKLAIDGYNVLFTLLNYRLGRFTFISTDDILRDAGSLHGKMRSETTFLDCVMLMMDFLASMQPEMTDIFLDSPVSHSEKHARAIGDLLVKYNLRGSCQVIRSADYALKHFPSGIISTSDTGIIENTPGLVIDLPRMILEQKYHATFINISGILLPGTD